MGKNDPLSMIHFTLTPGFTDLTWSLIQSQFLSTPADPADVPIRTKSVALFSQVLARRSLMIALKMYLPWNTLPSVAALALAVPL